MKNQLSKATPTNDQKDHTGKRRIESHFNSDCHSLSLSLSLSFFLSLCSLNNYLTRNAQVKISRNCLRKSKQETPPTSSFAVVVFKFFFLHSRRRIITDTGSPNSRIFSISVFLLYLNFLPQLHLLQPSSSFL